MSEQTPNYDWLDTQKDEQEIPGRIALVMKSIRITMPDGAKYDLPAGIVARSYAAHYARVDTNAPEGSDAYKEAYRTHILHAINSHDTLIDWLEGDMVWDDFKDELLLVKPPDKPDYGSVWLNASKEVVE